MCGVQLKDRKRVQGLMGLNEAMDTLAMTSSVHLYGHVFRREGGRVFGGALEFGVECQWKKGRPKDIHGRYR